jgi:hypothetical protein
MLLLVGCASSAPAWNGDVAVYGALRPMMHEGQTGTVVDMHRLLPDRALYAVGALGELAGEVTVVGGQAYLSYPDGPDATRTEISTDLDAGAALLVASRVSAWQDVTITETIAFEDIDARVAQLATAAGLDTSRRIPFLVEGELHDLRWHVIDGSRLPAGPSSHAAHQAAGVRSERATTQATLIGFHSESDQGVFTHMGSTTHVHCVLEAPLASGHVDHVTIPSGATIRFLVPRR